MENHLHMTFFKTLCSSVIIWLMFYLCFLHFCAHKKCPVKYIVHRNWLVTQKVWKTFSLEKSLEKCLWPECDSRANQSTDNVSLQFGRRLAVFFQFPIPLEKVGFPLKRICTIWNPALLWIILFTHPSQLLVWGGPWVKWAFDEPSF